MIVIAGLISKKGSDPPFLMSKRLPNAHLGGFWEFAESWRQEKVPEQALVREIREELGIEVSVGDIFAVGHHAYEKKVVLLLVYRA